MINMLAIISSLLGSAGQLLLKIGIKKDIIGTITSSPVIAGAIFYGFAFLLWLAALKEQPLSKLYPYLSLNFIFVPILAYLILHEPIDGRNILGYFFCIAGMLLASR
jgi:drug/metabolite transporter (DMT)-like permease